MQTMQPARLTRKLEIKIGKEKQNEQVQEKYLNQNIVPAKLRLTTHMISDILAGPGTNQ
jgi:hypothetical protein